MRADQGATRGCRRALRTVGSGWIALSLAWTALACGEAREVAPAPDVVLVMVDTLRADRTGALPGGPPHTPALDALGRRGVSYAQAVAPAAWTLPSMAALFAGRDAAGNRHAARADLPALAERLAGAGYETIGLVANPLLSADNGFARGFHAYDVAPASSTADLAADVHALRAWDGEALVARALSALGAAPPDRPVFLYLHLMDTHVPYDPAHETLAAESPGWSATAPEDRPPLVTWSASADLSAEQRQLLCAWRRAYDGQVRFTDAALARLFERLPELRGRPTLIAVSSDHGEGLFSHRRGPGSAEGPGPLGAAYPDHGEQVYEEALRVPLWLSGPGIPAEGRTEARPVALRDLGPTLLHLAGLPAGAGAGRLPLTEADAAPDAILGAGTRSWYVRTATHKLIVPFQPTAAGDAPTLQLHLVAADRYLPELVDRSESEPEVQRALVERWRAWLGASDEPADGPVDPATSDRLRMLGYLR